MSNKEEEITLKDLESKKVYSEPEHADPIPSQLDRFNEKKGSLVTNELDPKDFEDIKDNEPEEVKVEDGVKPEENTKNEIDPEDAAAKQDDDEVILTDPKPDSATENNSDLTDETLKTIKDDTASEEEKKKEEFKEFQKDIKNTVKLFDKVPLREFTVAKPINYTNTMKTEEITKVADWVLYGENRIVSMKEFKGYELNRLLVNDESRSVANRYRDMFNMIYAHINSAKPASMEAWIESLKWTSLDDLYFAIYKASFSGANHIPFKCPHCGKQYVARDIPMEKMYRFKDDETREKVEALLRSGNQGEIQKIVKLKQISDQYVFGIKAPSLFNISLEPTVLQEKLKDKYAGLLEILSYIDNIYYIDSENKVLRPIDLKEYPESKEKTLREKIFKYGAIINRLTPDQFAYFDTICRKMDTDLTGDIEYILPGTKCPHCGKSSTDQSTTAQQLLFTRHQLVTLGNM